MSSRIQAARSGFLGRGGRLEALARDWNMELKPEETRRNVVTEGAPLNHLVGRQFQIGGEVVLEGMRLNAPCQYLEDLVGIKSLFK